jgi:hypothetical protein
VALKHVLAAVTTETAIPSGAGFGSAAKTDPSGVKLSAATKPSRLTIRAVRLAARVATIRLIDDFLALCSRLHETFPGETDRAGRVDKGLETRRETAAPPTQHGPEVDEFQ